MPVINITSSVEERFAPDLCEVTMAIKGTKDSRANCVDEYNHRAERLQSALEKAGVAKDLVSTGEFTVSANMIQLYEKDDGYYYRSTQRPEGYVYHGSMVARLPVDADLFSALWAAVVPADPELAIDVDFCLDDVATARSTLLAKAVATGREQAETLATAAGCALGPVQEVTFGRSPHFSVPTALTYPGRARGSALMACGSAPGQAPSFSPEPIKVTCDVHLTWELEQA
ncbi:SIMPL domain-containing protein [Olsenella sp. YH-ols2217]|uniref:SIMPL domain-containing protein n=1 Tax=Kribbibacterium absianum TaxID=3044210 RepID=A0ABT6ZLA4_9ACTN|nr:MULTISPECIES: SIMPL domain-containing protein [unclassified Olsenella]MDJ1121817.1 SIMPL domain-containing protein [Olsenella sp. YH-ols2216]MDJ1129825.1 SIMPL domain-containing protein [Olsenella sp. YH-ols2217]